MLQCSYLIQNDIAEAEEAQRSYRGPIDTGYIPRNYLCKLVFWEQEKGHRKCKLNLAL